MDNPKPDATTNVPVPESPQLAAEQQRRATAELMHQTESPEPHEETSRDEEAPRQRD